MKKVFNWERWPFNAIYFPFIFLWTYYWMRGGRFWFFSNVNPTMYFSGFEGETKEEMYNQLPEGFFPKTIYINPKNNFDDILLRMKNVNLHFPVAVKPDVGTKGLLFRKIESEEQLKQYHKLLPFNYVIQEIIEWPLELSIFFVRYPNEQKGRITGIISKEYLHVVGDGTSTLETLIKKHPKAFMMAEEQMHKHKNNIACIVPANEIYYLNALGNHNRGATFKNLHKEIDEQLTNVINEINLFSKNFYYGRYDIKTTSLNDLKQGKNISILEFNGVGSEPNHIYDIGLTYKQAITIIAKHWKYMYEIGRMNYKKGIAYVSFRKGFQILKASKRHTALMQKLDLQC